MARTNTTRTRRRWSTYILTAYYPNGASHTGLKCRALSPEHAIEGTMRTTGAFDDAGNHMLPERAEVVG